MKADPTTAIYIYTHGRVHDDNVENENRKKEREKNVHEKLMKKSLFPLGCEDTRGGVIKKVKIARNGKFETI